MRRAAQLGAVVFDLDGTLIDSMALVLRVIAHAIEPYNPLSPEQIFPKLGGPPERFMAALLSDPQHIPLALARLNTRDNADWRLVRPFEGAADFLQRLRATGMKTALWTGRDRESGAWLLREHGFESLFDVAIYGDDLPTHKPDPAGLQEIMRRLGTTPAATLFVGDADVDVLGGVACGVDTLLIQHGREIAGPVAAQAWQSVATVGAAFELVQRLAAESGARDGTRSNGPV